VVTTPGRSTSPRHGKVTSLLGSRTFLGTIACQRRTCPSPTPTGPPGLGSNSSAYVILTLIFNVCMHFLCILNECDERPRRPGERHRLAEGHQMLQARRRRPWRHRLPTSSDCGWLGNLTPGRTTRTTPGLSLELLGRRGTDAFRCSTIFTMILYKLFASTH
jgi:hypothetical protein